MILGVNVGTVDGKNVGVAVDGTDVGVILGTIDGEKLGTRLKYKFEMVNVSSYIYLT